MHDLIIGCGAIVAGAAGLVLLDLINRRLPEREARMAQLRNMTPVELHAELTRCAGAIMTCAQMGDRKGARHAHRAMKPIIKTLYKK